MSEVPAVCTCGAQLPPDARFCHKCGKPQRDEPHLREEITEAPPPLPVAPELSEGPRIGFHNGFAVRAALTAGAIGFLGFLLTSQLAQQLALLWLGAGGFLAVYFYEKRTQHRLSVMSGARLGWLCGLFGFTAATIMLAMMALALTDPAVVTSLRQYSVQRGLPENMTDQAISVFQQPGGIFTALMVSFALFTVLPACGGAICAKLLSRD